jgi:hypothetical protein
VGRGARKLGCKQAARLGPGRVGAASCVMVQAKPGRSDAGCPRREDPPPAGVVALWGGSCERRPANLVSSVVAVSGARSPHCNQHCFSNNFRNDEAVRQILEIRHAKKNRNCKMGTLLPGKRLTSSEVSRDTERGNGFQQPSWHEKKTGIPDIVDGKICQQLS